MAIPPSTQTILLLLASTCFLLSFPQVSAQLENPTRCLPYRQNIEGCQRDLNVTVQNPNNSTGIHKLVPTCCKIMVEMKDVCLLLYFPGNAPAAFLLKRVCIIILRNAQPGAPSPSPPPSPSRLY